MTQLNVLWDPPHFPVCGHSRSAGFSLFSSSFRSRWFLSGSYLAVYSDHFIYLFITFRFVSFSEHRWTPFTLSAQLLYTSQKQFLLLDFSPHSQSVACWFFKTLLGIPSLGEGAGAQCLTQVLRHTRQMVVVSWAKDANRAVLTHSDTYSLVILPWWKLLIRRAG